MSISENIKNVCEKVANTAIRSGRKPDDIRIVAISKTHTIDIIKEAYDCGLKAFGENRVQEASSKIPLLPNDIEWHMVGHLQSNKAKTAVEFFNVIQSVDSFKIASKLEEHCVEFNKSVNVMIQIDLAREETKFGLEENMFYELCDHIHDNCQHLQLTGLMSIPPLFIDPEKTRPYFKALKEYYDAYNEKYPTKITNLSMGMSNDFEVAIEEGATVVRIGTAIFGERNL